MRSEVDAVGILGLQDPRSGVLQTAVILIDDFARESLRVVRKELRKSAIGIAVVVVVIVIVVVAVAVIPAVILVVAVRAVAVALGCIIAFVAPV